MPKVRGAFCELTNTREHGRTDRYGTAPPLPRCLHTSSVSARQLSARMAVCQNGEEYCRRKGDVSDEPNTEPAIEFFLGGGVTETSCICRDNSAETQFSSVQLISAEFSWVQLSSVQLSSAQFLVWTQGRPLQGFLGTLWRKWSKSASASCWWQCGWLWWWFKTAWHQNHTIIIRTTKACYWVQISNLSDIGHVSVLVTRQYWPRVSIGHVSVLITCQYCPRNAFSAL